MRPLANETRALTKRAHDRALRVALVGLAAQLMGCQTLLDFERARSLFSPAVAVEIPVLVETPPAELPEVGGLDAISGELRSVPLRWDPLLDEVVAGYTVERALDPKGPFERVGSVAGRHRTRWLDRGTDLFAKHDSPQGGGDLGDGHTYHYRVRAFDPEGHLAPAEKAAIRSAETAKTPAPPPGFQAFSHLPRRVALRWDPSHDPTTRGYVVYRSPTARGDFVPVAQLAGRFTTTHVDTDLGDLRVFYYRVAARNDAGGIGETTDRERAVTKPEPLPPIGLAIAEQGVGENRLRWQVNVESDLRTYRVLRRRADGDFEILAEVPSEEHGVTDRDVGSGESVDYALVAVDHDGLESARSEGVQVASMAYGLSAKSTDGGIEVTWSQEAQASLSEIRVLRLGSLGDRELGRSKETRFLDTSAAPGERVRIQLVGLRADGTEAPPSTVVEVTVPGSDR